MTTELPMKLGIGPCPAPKFFILAFQPESLERPANNQDQPVGLEWFSI